MAEFKFGVGDIARTKDGFLVKVVMPFEDEDGSIWYEIAPVDFEAPFNREVREEQLEA